MKAASEGVPAAVRLFNHADGQQNGDCSPN